MTHKFKVIAEFAKDISFETPDVEAFLKTKENIQGALCVFQEI